MVFAGIGVAGSIIYVVSISSQRQGDAGARLVNALSHIQAQPPNTYHPPALSCCYVMARRSLKFAHMNPTVARLGVPKWGYAVKKLRAAPTFARKPRRGVRCACLSNR